MNANDLMTRTPQQPSGDDLNSDVLLAGDFGDKVTSFKTGPNNVVGVYDFGNFCVVCNVGQRIAPPYLHIENPMVQGGSLLNDNIIPTMRGPGGGGGGMRHLTPFD